MNGLPGMPLDQYIEDILGIEEEDLLFARLLSFLHQFAADVLSYHVVTEHLRRLRLDQGLVYHCFPPAWVARYKEMGYFDIDPIIDRAMRTREPFHWYDISELQKLTPAQNALLDDLRAHGLVDGYAVPIFGPQGTTAYFGVGSTYGDMEVDAVALRQIQYACNTLHNRYLEIHGEIDGGHPLLTNREREVLTWIARGKSNSSIAGILGISDHTVDTLVRRCFQKLSVSDRISASLKGVATGVISP